MNKLLTNINGGYPFELDDLRFEQDGIRNAFEGILKGIGIDDSHDYVISGVNPVITLPGTDRQCDISAGWCSINGEILPVDAQSLSGPVASTQAFYLKLDVSFDPAGQETFEDASTQDTYEVRKAILVLDNVVPPADHIRIGTNSVDDDYPDLNWIFKQRMQAITPDAWREVGTTGEPAYQNSFVAKAGQPLQFRKDNDGLIHVQGVADGASATGPTIFTLPTGYRPTQPIWWLAPLGSLSSNNIMGVETNGDVKVKSGPNTEEIYFNLTFSAT